MLVLTVPGDHSRRVTICYALLISNAGFYRSRQRHVDSKCSGSADMLFVLREKLKLFLQRGIFSDALLISNAGFYRSMRSFKGVIICYALLISSGGFYLFRRSLKGVTICYALLIGNAGFYRGLRPSNLQCWFLLWANPRLKCFQSTPCEIGYVVNLDILRHQHVGRPIISNLECIQVCHKPSCFFRYAPPWHNFQVTE